MILVEHKKVSYRYTTNIINRHVFVFDERYETCGKVITCLHSRNSNKMKQVRYGLKNKDHKDTCLKEIELFSNFVSYSTLNSEHNWDDLCIDNESINKKMIEP